MTDLLSAISIFLVFLTFLFNSIEKEVSDSLAKKKPEKEQSDNIKIYKSDLSKLIFYKSLPITITFAISFYILFPNTVNIISNSTIKFWDFDELNTLFVFIETGLLGLTVYSIKNTYKLLMKYLKL